MAAKTTTIFDKLSPLQTTVPVRAKKCKMNEMVKIDKESKGVMKEDSDRRGKGEELLSHARSPFE